MKRCTLLQQSLTTSDAHTSCVTLAPKRYPAPLGLMAQPAISSGSDHTRSVERQWEEKWYDSNQGLLKYTTYMYIGYQHELDGNSPQNAPSWGTSTPLSIVRIWKEIMLTNRDMSLHAAFHTSAVWVVYLIKCLDFWREPTMNTQHLFINDLQRHPHHTCTCTWNHTVMYMYV